MTTVAPGAVFALVGVASLLLSPYLARGDAYILRKVWQLDLADRGVGMIWWLRMIGSAGFVILGIFLMVAAPDIDREYWTTALPVVVATIMVTAFVPVFVRNVKASWGNGRSQGSRSRLGFERRL